MTQKLYSEYRYSERSKFNWFFFLHETYMWYGGSSLYKWRPQGLLCHRPQSRGLKFNIGCKWKNNLRLFSLEGHQNIFLNICIGDPLNIFVEN